MTSVSSESDQSVSREETTPELDQVEVRLREASLLGRAELGDLDLDPLMRRARREIGLRDVVSFGFAHMLTTMLALVANVFGRAQARTDPQSPAPAPLVAREFESGITIQVGNSTGKK